MFCIPKIPTTVYVQMTILLSHKQLYLATFDDNTAKPKEYSNNYFHLLCLDRPESLLIALTSHVVQELLQLAAHQGPTWCGWGSTVTGGGCGSIGGGQTTGASVVGSS